MINSTYIMAQLSAFGGKRGRQIQALARSLSRRIYDQGPRAHAVIGRPCVLMLTAGNVSDMKAAPALLECAGRMRELLADKGYDAAQQCDSLRDAEPVRSFPNDETAHAPSAKTWTDTAAAT